MANRAAEIRAALEDITPIEQWQEWDNGYEGSDFVGGIRIGEFHIESGEDLPYSDCQLILNAPTWLRDLLAAVEAVRPLVNAERRQLSSEQLAAWDALAALDTEGAGHE